MESKLTDSFKVVIIDDEESIRDTFKWYLEDLGYEVATFSEPGYCHVYHGHECSQERACADALLIDYNMPGMNGLEFISQLVKRGCRGMAANMMIMSGNTSAIDMALAKQLGCTVVQKPFPLESLQAWLEEIKTRKNSD